MNLPPYGRAALDWLRRPSDRPSRLTPWGFAADAILAVMLTIGAVSGVLTAGDAPVVLPGPVGAWPVDGPPGAPVPPLPPFVPVDGLGGAPVGLGTVILAALTALPLVTRRRFPLASFWVIAVAAPSVYGLAGANPTWTVVASVVAAYSAPTYSRYRNLALASVVVAALGLILGRRDDLPALSSGVVTFVLLSAVALAANAVHIWRQRAQTLQREHEAATRLAVDRERARLARELHDVVTHNVSVMVIQAGAARTVLRTSPGAAQEALLAVEAGGRAAMTELRQVIGLLTVDADGADLAPPPGVDQIPALAARVRETGVAVTVRRDGPFDGLPAGVDLAAYRVVQEALTNAVKHAAGAEVTVVLTGRPDEIRIEVSDTGGTVAPVAAGGSGRGLAGLRERVAVYGGTLTAARRPTGGFRVVAVIPVRGDG